MICYMELWKHGGTHPINAEIRPSKPRHVLLYRFPSPDLEDPSVAPTVQWKSGYRRQPHCGLQPWPAARVSIVDDYLDALNDSNGSRARTGRRLRVVKLLLDEEEPEHVADQSGCDDKGDAMIRGMSCAAVVTS